ncbi:hypothetical protein [Arthrobacter sp. L77]|uniref:hypothetical protein n=1 Tax=Arthrobacter sp. L77 TaxID=1496689 RepID=UPI0012E03D0D|nr:hypothetical protein [Arthrobacter sp. L77]
MKTAHRGIRLFVDYGHRWPLGENSTDERPTKYTMEPAGFGPSWNLTRRLRIRPDMRDADNSFGSDGSSPESEVAWKEEGANIAEGLRAEVGAFADVEYDE